MSINCLEIKKLLPEKLQRIYKQLSEAVNTHDLYDNILPKLKKEGFDTIQQFFKYIENAVETSKNIKDKEVFLKDLKEFHNYIQKGYEVANIATSNTYAYIKKIAEVGAIDNTLKYINKILDGKLDPRHLEALISEYHNFIVAIDDMIRNRKELGLTGEELERLTKMYYGDSELMSILKQYKKNKKLGEDLLKTYKQRLVDKRNLTRTEGLMSGIYGANINHQVVSELKKLGKEDFFMNKKTAERNINRIISKGEYKTFGNMYNVYKESIGKYEDIIKEIYYKELESENFIVNKGQEIVSELQNKGINAELIRTLEDGRILIKDKDNGTVMLLDRKAYMTPNEDIINYFTKAMDGGEATVKNISDGSEKMLNHIEKEEVDSDNVIKELANEYLDKLEKGGNFSEEELKTYREILSRYKEMKASELEDIAVELSNMRLYLGDNIGKSFYEDAGLRALDNVLNNSWLLQLNENLNYLKETNPFIYKILTTAQGIAETFVKDKHMKLLDKIVSFRDKKVYQKYVEDEIFYSALETIPYKELIEGNEYKELYIKMKGFYDELKSAGKSKDEIINKLSERIKEFVYSNNENKTVDNIASSIRSHLDGFIRSRTERDIGGYVAYLKWKYHNEVNLFNIEELATEYYNTLKQHIPGLDEERFIKAFTQDIRGVALSNKNLANVYVKLRTSFETIDKAMYMGTSTVGDNLFEKTLLGLSNYNGFIKERLKETITKDKIIRRIMGDLYGESLFGKDGFMKYYGIMRNWTAKLFLTSIGGKGLGIAAQNLYSGVLGAITRYGTDSELVKKIGEELARLEKHDDLNQVLLEVFDPLNNQVGKWLEEAERPLGEKVMDWLNIKLGEAADMIKKGTKEKVVKANIAGKAYNITMGLPGLVDDIVYRLFVRDNVLNKIYHEKGITASEIKKLVDTIEGKDKIAAQEAKNKLISLLREAKAEALNEYQTFFKSAYHQGLNRNVFSRRVFLNFFSSWGSKMFGDHFYHMIQKPIKNFRLTYNFTGDLSQAFDSFFHTLTTSDRFQSMVKQITLGAQAFYQISKDDNVDGSAKDAIINSTLAYQAWISFVMTRAINNAFGHFIDIYDRKEGTLSDKALSSILQGARTIVKNLVRETKVLGNLPYDYFMLAAQHDLNADSAWYVTKYWLLNNINNSLLFDMYDIVNGQMVQRFDDKTKYGILEGLGGFSITKWTEVKEEMINSKKYLEFLNNPNKIAGDTFSLALLGTTYGALNSRKKHKQSEILKNDSNLLKIQNEAILPDDYYTDPNKVKSLNSIIKKSSLLGGRDFDDPNTIDEAKLQLVFNDLRKQGVNPDNIVRLIQTNLLTGKQKEVAKVLTMLNSKAGAAVLLSYVTTKALQEKEQELKKMYGKNIPEEVLALEKGNIIKQVLPQLARLDRNLHAKLLGLYIKNTYMQKGSDYEKIFGTKITKELQTKLFAQVADLDKSYWRNDKFNSYPVRFLDGIPDKQKPDMINQVFDWIDESGVSYYTNIITKASVLYNNYKFIKQLLEQNPDKFKGAAEKLADLIWTVDEKITKDPALLEALGDGNIKVKNMKIKLPNNKLPNRVKKKVHQLKDLITKIPHFHNLVLNKTYEKIKGKYKPFTYKIPETNVGIRKEQLKSITPGELKTKLLEVKSKYLKSKRVRKPKVSSIEKVLRKTKSNSRNRKTIKPSRPNR